MKVQIIGLNGKKKDEIETDIFSHPKRDDLIKRAVLSIESGSFQPKGMHPQAGNRSSAAWDGTRKGYGHGYGYGHSRVPRLMLSGGRRVGKAMNVAGIVGGRKAHGPKVEKVFKEKINKKENKKAFYGALSAVADKETVEKRGHKFDAALPLVVDDSFSKLKKTKEVLDVFSKLKVSDDLTRVNKKIRAGKGKRRGRRYKTGKSILIVTEKDEGIKKAASNILGVDCVLRKNLNVKDLAPGTHPGRLVIFTKEAVKNL